MISTYNFNCIEQLSEKIKHVDVSNLQLKRGSYKSEFSQIIINENIIHQIHTNISTSSEGLTHKDFYMFLLISSKETQIFKNNLLTYTSIIVMEPLTQYSKFSFGENTILVLYIPKHKIEEKFNYLPSGIYDIKNKKNIDLLISLSSLLFNSQVQNNQLIEYYSSQIIEKMLASLMNMQSSCNNCKQCKRCLQFYKINEFMKKEYKNNLSIEEIAFHFKITDRTLRNIFQRQIGISPKQYQKSLQMNFLKQEIIKNPSANIIDIMENQGMSLQSFISKEFKSYFQLTPNEYKKRNL